MVGYAALFLAMIMTGIATFAYFNAHLAKVTRRSLLPGKGRITTHKYYYLAATCVLLAAAYLLYLLMGNHFEYAYVFSYSSLDLPLAYKISAFWAGQEGSFMLWSVLQVLFGLIMIQRKSPPGALAVYCLLQSFLLAVLLAKSPFMMLTELKLDGAGLNPLLQDPWMVIHPPIIFLGYAGLAVPFAYALEGLLSGHRFWINRSLSWTLFSCSALGAGIFIGGFWAYKVLGWGGYWGWDPVENSSLVPWLVGVAVIHLLLLAQVRPVAVKPAYLAVIFTFVLVLYGTFLTRSGILSDFSTHSFADEGIGGLLAVFLLLTTLAAMILLIVKWPGLPQGDLYIRMNSREFVLACAGLVLAVIAVLVLIGMSTPLLTLLMGRPQNVSTAFYNTTTLPLAALLAVLLTVGPLVKWGEHDNELRRYWPLALIAVITMAGGWWLGLHNILALVVTALAFAACITNLLMAVREKQQNRPASVAHLGVAVLLVGIMFSSGAGQGVSLQMAAGETLEVFDKHLSYLGTYKSEDGKGIYQSFQLAEAPDYILQPYTKLNKEGRPAAHEPGIYRGLTADIYLAPTISQEQRPLTEVMLHKGEQQMVEGMLIKFSNLSMNGRGGNEEIRVQAVLEITKDGETQELKPEMTYRNGQGKAMPIQIFDTYEIMLAAVNPGEKAINLGLRTLVQTEQSEKIAVEITRKPLINFVWIGTCLIAIGGIWAAWSRIRAC
jgi:cytochrome c-type biogenesis protein CcmF